ncbi:deleted in malignant brain tumors 1 protein-like [Pristis pectinata]|uniref:deleted in malignant brain tumors 1 protein-like n=1 Tax=Pristis pectinata TaxID=685728 RepID=UPI00223CB790|nr:deleted in malignant brain tumors 1 protein-like [Pristis pectinata]
MPSDSCGGVMRQSEGRFQTPHYPQSYPSNMECTWRLKLLGIPHPFWILFLCLSRNTRTCKYDYVVVYDGKGPNKVEMGRFCGSKLPPQLQGSSNTMSITMRSDSSMELEGFSAQFSTFQIPAGYIHLVGGKNIYDGVLEIESDGQWGGICANHWTNRDATVVCRQLGFSGPALAARVDASQQSPQTASHIKCRGDEVTLQDCDIKPNGTCAMGKRAAVFCMVMESCAALKSAGVRESGIFTIDPDGVDGGVDPFPVECDMISDSTTG